MLHWSSYTPSEFEILGFISNGREVLQYLSGGLLMPIWASWKDPVGVLLLAEFFGVSSDEIITRVCEVDATPPALVSSFRLDSLNHGYFQLHHADAYLDDEGDEWETVFEASNLFETLVNAILKQLICEGLANGTKVEYIVRHYQRTGIALVCLTSKSAKMEQYRSGSTPQWRKSEHGHW